MTTCHAKARQAVRRSSVTKALHLQLVHCEQPCVCQSGNTSCHFGQWLIRKFHQPLVNTPLKNGVYLVHPTMCNPSKNCQKSASMDLYSTKSTVLKAINLKTYSVCTKGVSNPFVVVGPRKRANNACLLSQCAYSFQDVVVSAITLKLHSQWASTESPHCFLLYSPCSHPCADKESPMCTHEGLPTLLIDVE